jgi:acyl-CoA thioesterase-1
MRVQKPIHILVTLAVFALFTACNPANEAVITPPPSVAQANTSEPAPALVPAKVGYVLVMLGDSLTAGLGLSPDDSFPTIVQNDFAKNGRPDVRILNAGVSGDTSKSALARFDWSVGPETDGVLIAIGANDMLNGLEPEQTRNNIEAMIKAARQRKLDVFLTAMRAAPNMGADYGTAFDGLYEALATQYCVALYPFLLQALASADGQSIDQNLIQRDGLHPTKAGAKRIGHALSGWLDTQLDTPHIPCAPKTK